MLKTHRVRFMVLTAIVTLTLGTPHSEAWIAPRAKKSKQRSATVQWVKKKSAQATANTNNIATGAFASNTTTGNLMVCAIGIVSATATVTGVSDSAGNTYSKAKSYANFLGQGGSLEIWYKENITGGASVSVTATFSATLNTLKQISCHEYSGIVTSGALDQVAISGGYSGHQTGGQVNITTDNQLLFSFFWNQGSSMRGNGHQRDATNGNPVIDQFTNKKGTYQNTAQWQSGWSSLVATFKGSGTPTWRQKAEATATSGSSTTIQTAAFASNPLAGSLIVCSVMSPQGNIQTNSLADTAGNTYFFATGIANSTPWHHQSIWYARNITSGASFKVTATYSASAPASRIISCHEYTGIATTNPLDQTSVSTNYKGNPISAAVTTTQASELLFNAVIHFGNGETSQGWNTRSTLNNDIYQDKIVSSIGTYRAIVDENINWYGSVTATFKAKAEPNPITVVQDVMYQDWVTNTTSLIMPPFNAPSHSTPGNAIVCTFDYDTTTASVTSVTDTAGNTYTRAGVINRIAAYSRSNETWYASNIKGAAYNQVTATLSTSAVAFKFGVCGEFSGLAQSPFDQYANLVTTSNTNFSSGSMTTTARNSLLLGYGLCSNGSASTGSGFTSFQTGDLWEYRTVETAGAWSVTGTTSPAADCSMHANTFKAAVNNPKAPAISYVQTTTTSLSTTAPINFSFPTQPQIGNMVLVKILQAHSSVPTVSSVSDNNGNTYSVGCSQGGGGPNARASIYYSKLTSVSTSPLTITVNGTASKWTINAQEYSGLTSLDQTANQASGTATTNPWAGVTALTTAANELLSGVMVFNGTFNSISTNGYVNRLQNANATYAIGSSDDLVVIGDDTYYVDWWTDTSNTYAACLATFK